ncbi:MAG: HAD family phosphatase [Kiritimatiellae bacterium]|nr:HAD family phosphatase [Kiritimatiellia bacterium]
MIRAVIFDFGGVISKPQNRAMLQDWARDHAGLSEVEIRDGYAAFRPGFDGGVYSGAEMYRRILSALGKPYTEALLTELERRDMESWSVPNPETLAWARELKGAGFKVGILTNMPLTFLPWFDRAASAFRALADAEVISAAVRLVKPQPEIYRLMLERLAVRPDEAIFFDDMPGNVEGARKVGLFSERFTSVAAAKVALEKVMRDLAQDR